jgi:formate C-acetyltransferase
MPVAASEQKMSYAERLEALRIAKRAQTLEKQSVRGSMDFDDHGIVLPPEGQYQVVHTMSGSGVEITDAILSTFIPSGNHPGGEFFGARACGENFRKLLEIHPVHIDPASSLAGAYMVNFMSYRKLSWNPDVDCSGLLAEHEKYHTIPVIGAVQHMCPDLAIGLCLGWGGLLEQVHHGALANPHAVDFYAGLEHVILGAQDWIQRHAETASRMAAEDSTLAENLAEIAEMNARLVTAAPRSFRDACQWILWYLLIARMYNGSGGLGKLDLLLQPYYEADSKAGCLTDDEATFHLACLLVRDTAYLQLGGPNESGKDATNHVSYLILEAAHQLGIATNIGVAAGKEVDKNLLHRGVEILVEDRCGTPKFLGVDSTIAGFTANGFPIELARQRAYAGCHWSAIPGREYACMDVVKFSFPAILNVSLREMMADHAVSPGVAELWKRFKFHLRSAIATAATGIDFHYEHMHQNFPELVIDLLCHGPLENGLDASHGGVEFYTFGVDGAGLATAADSLAALEEQVESKRRLSWTELMKHLNSDWAGAQGEKARRQMLGSGRFGEGHSTGDEWAVRIAAEFTQAVKEKPTPRGLMMIPGIFSWVLNIQLGKKLCATPNGRRAGERISHGANPDPGFRHDAAPTALAVAVAKVQCGYGNTSPMQMDIDLSHGDTTHNVAMLEALIGGHFELGGTQINMNVVNREQILEAHADPSRFPDLVVRVTGFSAYFSSLSPELRQLVVDRLLCESGTR